MGQIIAAMFPQKSNIKDRFNCRNSAHHWNGLLWLLLVGVCFPGWFLTPLRAGTEEPSWNQFRGAAGSGVARDSQPPTKLGPDNLAWKIKIPGGLSSPITAGQRLIITGLEGESLVTLAFDTTTGNQIWRREAPKVSLEKTHEFGHPAASTPCIANGRVFVYFGSFGLLVYDLMDGHDLWQKPMPTPQSLYGMSTSPITYGDNLILALDDDANLPDSKASRSRLMAIRQENGDPVWEAPRPLARSAWSTPTVWKHDTGEDLVVFGSGRLCGYDPNTGTEKWFVTGFAREAIVQPVLGKGLVFASSALGGAPDEHADPEPLWQAMLQFDANGDGRIARTEITKYFNYPLRAEVPVDHPGFGIPLPADPEKRKERQNEIFGWIDKNHDGFWTHEEFVASISSRGNKPKLVAVRPGGKGDVTSTHVEWELRKCIPEVPSALFYGDLLYLVRNGGLMTAVSPGDGKILFDERLNAPGQYTASPVAAGGHIYLVSNPGIVSVVKAGATFDLRHQYNLQEPALVTPALDANTVYIRSQTQLWAFRSTPPEARPVLPQK